LFNFIVKTEKLDEKTEKISKQNFVSFWRKEFEMETAAKRTFKVLA
jgi:predicted adenine nucleotide alpha hydrolase (AANH) superfamily ATPase